MAIKDARKKRAAVKEMTKVVAEAKQLRSNLYKGNLSELSANRNHLLPASGKYKI